MCSSSSFIWLNHPLGFTSRLLHGSELTPVFGSGFLVCPRRNYIFLRFPDRQTRLLGCLDGITHTTNTSPDCFLPRHYAQAGWKFHSISECLELKSTEEFFVETFLGGLYYRRDFAHQNFGGQPGYSEKVSPGS